MEDAVGEHPPEVSIIIPCKEIDAYAQRCFDICREMYPDYEILVIPDCIVPGYPAAKRNWAMKIARGKVFAFIDSDAYPAVNWLENALYWLRFYPAVCGPGPLPYDAPQGERIIDLIYQMMPYAYRVIPMEPRVVAEYPTFNLVVRRDVATEFDNYLTGEDSLFCRRIKDGVYYHPSIVVYHNRRPGFKKFWKQIGTYGKHRGNFIKIALFGWISAVFVYAFNFVKGFFMRRPS